VDERRVAAIAGLTALGWLAGPLLSHLLPGTSDTAVALAGALALFALPSAGGGALLRWQDAARIKWDVLLLFGGGLSLAEAMAGTGLADGIGAGLATALSSVPTLVAVGVVIAVVVLLSELASNTATAAAFLPIAGGLAVALGLPPVALVVTVALAASCGYMLPVATPPNAIVFGSGAVSIRDMAAAGAWLDAAAIVVLMAAAQMLLALV
jgi:solute carrier family 13 (sodium-dependent dicarboxylate transporter), member 2/3/5